MAKPKVRMQIEEQPVEQTTVEEQPVVAEVTAAAAPQDPPAPAPAEGAQPAGKRKAEAAPQAKGKVVVEQQASPRPAQHEASVPPKSKPKPTTKPEPAEPAKGPLGWLDRTFPGHRNAALGGIAGLLIALLVFLVGFWKTLFTCLLMAVGVIAGQWFDGDRTIIDALRRLFAEGSSDDQE